MIGWLHSAWDRLSLYVPVILMGLLALGTYWLVRSTPLTQPTGREVQVQHEPDYFMRQFSVKTFDATGRLKSEVRGTYARHYPDTDTVEIDLVNIRSYNEAGRLTTATAKRALTNADASEVRLFGDAHVVSESIIDSAGKTLPRVAYRSEFLHAFIETERVVSDKPVTLTRGRDQFTADSMDFSNQDGFMQLKGRVKGVLVPGIAN
jgi:lipopolysaccharide export system protein LptC